MRAGVTMVKSNMVKEGFIEEDKPCKCRECQTDEHLLLCTMNPVQRIIEDLARAIINAMNVAVM